MDATTAPTPPTQIGTFITRLEQNNGRLSETIIRLRETRTRLLGSFPEKGEGDAGVRAMPTPHLSRLDVLLSDQKDMLEQLDVLAGNFETV